MDLERLIKKCEAAHIKCTSKRKNVLALLLRAKKPLSAHQLCDHYMKRYGDSLSVMSVYRILKLFVDNELVHYLLSAKKYVLCKHSGCEHAHPNPLFLICEKCSAVEELDVSTKGLQALQVMAVKNKFELTTPQVEWYGRCQRC